MSSRAFRAASTLWLAFFAAPVAAVPAPCASLHLDRDSVLDPAAVAATGAAPSRPALAPAPRPAPLLFGASATEQRPMPTCHGAPGSAPFSVELWLLDHVNRPVGALVSGTAADGSGGWALGYWSDAANAKFIIGPSLLFGPLVIRADAERPRPGYRLYLHHLVGSFDGTMWRLYQQGRLVGERAGPPQPAGALDITAYLAAEPYMRMADLVRDVAVYDHAVGPDEAAALFAQRRSAVEQGAAGGGGPQFTAGPYLTPPGQGSQGLLWETDRPAEGLVEWGETSAYGREARFGPDRLHRFTFAGLLPDTAYYYRVTARFADGTSIRSEPLSFRSMPAPGQPLVFGVMADTQERPFINLQLSRQLWRQRPQLLVVAGDLIGGEEADRRWHWAEEYFAGMGPIVSRVPVLAARGNGDVDVVDPASDLRRFTSFDHYHNQPDAGTGYFRRRIGDVEFFVLDGNLALRERGRPGFRQRQRQWLDQALRTSDAIWKIAIHHQPAYSADADDYGDAAQGPTSGGDPEIRRDFVDLYDRYGVDLVLSGHIHGYERSWPLRSGRPDPDGTVYVQIGGGGGDHEYPGPTRGATAAALADGYHFGLVRLFAGRLEMIVADAEGRTIDRFALAARRHVPPAGVSPPALPGAAAARNGPPTAASAPGR